MHKFPIQMRGILLYSAQDPKALSQIRSIHLFESSFLTSVLSLQVLSSHICKLYCQQKKYKLLYLLDFCSTIFQGSSVRASMNLLIPERCNALQRAGSDSMYTVKRVDEVVRHQHLVTQDQFTQVSEKISDIPVENFTINIELFRLNFSNVELLRQKWIV